VQDIVQLSGVAEGSNALLLAGHIVAGNGRCTWFVRTPNHSTGSTAIAAAIAVHIGPYPGHLIRTGPT